MKLYLDDRRTPPVGEDIKSADNYADFLALLDKYRNCIECVSLDYDLGWDSMYSGYNVLEYMKKLISGESRKPSLETAVGLAMALHLTYDEAVELFASAGIALSNSSRFDIIVSYFLKNQNYNTWDMDVQLLKYGYKTIFSTL